jgi:hypothetical protein
MLNEQLLPFTLTGYSLFNIVFFLSFCNDLAHTRSILRQQAIGRIDVLRRKEIDAVLLALNFEPVQVEERHDAQRFYFGPLEPRVTMTFEYDKLVLAYRYTTDTIAHKGIHHHQQESERKEHQRYKEGLAVEIFPKEYNAANDPLDQREYKEKVFRKIIFSRIRFYHFY